MPHPDILTHHNTKPKPGLFMRPEIEFLLNLDRPINRTKLEELGQRVFDDELKLIIQDAYHSEFHEYVKENGYPIPPEIYQSAYYISRPRIEASIRKNISRKNNIIILGCEGSGKTTLIHYVLGNTKNGNKYFYLDTSDFSFEEDTTFYLFLQRKLLQSLVSSSSEEELKDFEIWLENIQKNKLKLKYLIQSSGSDSFVENFLVWHSLMQEKHVFLVIDNIDSLNLEASQTLFHLLNNIFSDIRIKLSNIDGNKQDKIRFILSCRTATYHMVSSASHGLFLNTMYEVVQAENDLKKNLSVANLVSGYILSTIKRRNSIFENNPIPIHIRPGVTETINLENYIRLVDNWLSKPPDVFGAIIKGFCGRSIRRMKLYGVRVFSNPIIAMMALLERRNAIDVSRHDKRYLERRIYEALFDFRISGKVGSTLAFGLPLNPFQIIDDPDEYKANPLIGPTTFSFLRENLFELLGEDVYFAKSLHVDKILETLQKIGYSEVAIHDLFTKLFFAGILRPIRTSNILIRGDAEYRDIFSRYILDDRALKSYQELLFCREPRISMQFYNSSVRYFYGLDYYRLADNLLYEAFLSLIFLKDIIAREDKLRAMNARTGVLLHSYAARIREPLLKNCNSIILDFEETIKKNHLRGPREERLELHTQASELYWKVYRAAADVETFL